MRPLVALDVKGLPVNRKWFVVKHAGKRFLPSAQALWNFVARNGKHDLAKAELRPAPASIWKGPSTGHRNQCSSNPSRSFGEIDDVIIKEYSLFKLAEERMDFGGDIGLWQRKIAEGLEGTARRLAVIETLAINSGQAILDLGCGGGHLIRDVALAVGDDGRAVGLDASKDQIFAAKSLCADLASAELIEGDATDLPFANASFDSLASIQMLEYVPDVDAALSEARRILKPVGKAALVSVLWDHWRFHGAEPELNDKIHDIWREHCFHQMLPFELPAKLIAAGFDGISQKPIAFMNNTMHDNSFSLWAAKVVAGFAVAKGLDENEAASWLNQLDEADAAGRFGFVSVPVLTTAIAASR